MMVEMKSAWPIGALVLAAAGLAWVSPDTNTANILSPLVNEEPIIVMAGGDVNMGRFIGKRILAGEIDFPFAKIAPTLQDADITFVNLESQLADLGGETQSPTSEFRFAGPPEAARSLKNAGIDIVSVANNHMWDYGKSRLFETLDSLAAEGVNFVGANKVPDEKHKPAIYEMRNKKIAFLAMTTLLNGYENAGAPEYVSFNSKNEIIVEINKIKDSVDWIFVSIHTGTEYKLTPNSDIVTLSHDLIDAGADVILGHHPHVPQPIETYKEKPIFYSSGNFAFWQPFSFWTQHSYLTRFTLKEPHKVEYSIVPVKSGWQPEVETDQAAIDQILKLLHSPI